jgi:hypothetical protein
MIYELVRNAYDATLRHRLPRKIVVHNGVAVRSGRLLDATDAKPDYEASLVAAIRERVAPGDDVVIVGGGRGVSAVVAARRAGPDGSVILYEGAASQIGLVEETLALNEAADGVTVEHAVVVDPRDLWSEAEDAERVDPATLPNCDVLVLDCEGSEVEIVRDGNLPRTVVVETHGVFDAPTEQTRSLLEDRGYEIRRDRVEIAAEDVHVLTAVRE